MGTKFAVAGSNLVVTYEEVKIFFFSIKMIYTSLLTTFTI